MIIYSYQHIASLCKAAKTAYNGTNIVFTNGCFDLFHYGHLDSLTIAKSFGGFLIVGINSDESIKKFKDPSRPIISERQRAMIVNSLKMVNHVVVFNEKSPKELIGVIQPDVVVKGEEYSDDELRDMTSLANSCEIKILKKIPEISTSLIIKRIKECT